jgi:ribosomal protein S18 acetylase RimI-like enzyme
MGDLVLRRATLSDRQALLDIEARSFSSERLSPRQMGYLLSRAKATTWLALYNDQAAGYGMVLLPAKPRPARLYSIAVSPEFRGRQIARALLNQSIQSAKQAGYGCIRLEVSVQNTAAQKLYLAFGFQPICDLPGYYEDGSSGCRMQYRICY